MGILYGAIDARRLQSIIADKTGLQSSGELLLGYQDDRADTDGSVESLFPTDESHRAILPFRNLQLAVANASGCLQEIGLFGHQVLTCYQPVGYRNWGE